MQFSSIPIIVLVCYVVGEVYKFLFQKKQENYKFIPIFLSILGGILGILMYFTNKEMLMNVSNLWIALGVGMVSGASATGANQIIKQLFKKEKGEKKYEN